MVRMNRPSPALRSHRLRLLLSWPLLRFLRRPTAALMFFLCLLPDLLVAARLELRHGLDGPSELTAMVGDEFDVVLWVDSEGEALSGATVFLTFDDRAFELVAEDRDPDAIGFQPFLKGSFLRNADNYRNTILDPADPAASPAGAQLDYSVGRSRDQGAGPAASFRLRAKAPVRNSVIQIDESGIRETRFFMPDGSNRSFRFITPLQVDVQGPICSNHYPRHCISRGIEIEGMPQRVVLARGQVDSTTFQLDSFVFDPLFGPREISWSVSSSSSLDVDLDVDLNIVFVTAPVGDSPWERLTFTASNPDGQTASATIDVFVNEGPVLSAAIAPIQMEEDGAMDLELDGLVEDPDTPLSQLQWSATSPSGLAVTITGPPYVAHLAPTTNWHGEVQISLVVVDEFGFADTAAVAVSVASVNDAPEMLISPNVRLIRGRRDSSLTLAQLIAEADHGLDELELRWTGADKVEIELRGGRLVLSASAVWLGTETIQLEVTDGEGLTANAPLTVTVIQSLPPSIVDPPRRLGLPAGEETIIELQSFVVDPDDPRSALQWRASGQQQLSIQLSSSGAARLVAPVGFSGSEVLHFEVTDPSGEQAFFGLMVFAASAGGEPAIAPLPDIEVPLGGVDASLDLDDYVFDLDHEPSRMEWEVPVTEGLELRVDPLSHVLTVTASDSARTGDLDILLRVRDPDGNESSQSLTIRIPAAPGDTTPVDDPEITPILASLPTLTLVEGAFDQSLVLDDYLSGIDPATISWKVEGQQHAEILVDPESRRVTVLAGLDWSGTEIIIFRGEDELGHTVEGMLGLRILPNTVALSLRELTEVSVLAGDRQFELGLAGLLEGDGDAGLLEWEVRANRVYTVAYDAESNSLELTAEAMPLGDEVLTLVARMGDSEELTGVVVVHAHPVDGSFGADSDDLRIAVIPNPLQPDYIDIYVLSDLATRRVPRLRLHDGDWRDLAVTELAVADVAVAGRLPGIWHGRHVLPTHAAGDIRFLALTLEGEEVLKTDYTLIVGLPPSVSSPKAVSADVLTDAVR